MKQLVKRLLFAHKITAGIPSFVRLVWHSKKLRWNKSGLLKADLSSAPAIIQIKSTGKKKEILLRTYDGDIDIFFEIFYHKIYDLPQVDPVSIRTIVDLGANVGMSVLYFLQQYPQANVLCVEPEPSNFSQLSKNLSTEINNGKVTALEMAVMNEDGNVFFESAAIKYNSKIKDGNGAANIKAICMNTLLDRFSIDHIDLLKVDVEGAEKYIFSSNTGWLKKVDNIIIELHGAEARAICMKSLQDYGFTVSQLNATPSNENLYWAKKR